VRSAAAWLIATLAAWAVGPAWGWVLVITPGTRALYLQVGTGTANASNAAVNTVSLALPATAIGNGTAQPMTSDSAVSQSFFDGFVVCRPPREVYIGAWFRMPSAGASAVLQVNTPASLTSGADSLPFSQISWVSTAIGSGADIPSGTFGTGTQTLRSIAANRWVENCLSFNYANTSVLPAGTYVGRATYTLSAP
jgi:hypothetical protein